MCTMLAVRLRLRGLVLVNLMVGYNQRSIQNKIPESPASGGFVREGWCIAELLSTDHCAQPLIVDNPETFGHSSLTPLTRRTRRQYANTVHDAEDGVSLYI